MSKSLSLSDSKAGAWWLFLFGFIVLFVPTLFIVWKVLRYTHGIFMYPYDDTFIHLTIADNLLKGNWGVNPHQFASASSSILYTLILALFRLFSKSILIPFLVNCLAGVAILIGVHLWLKKHRISNVAQGVIFLLIIFFTPLPLLIVSGMEHTLQCLFSFLFIFYFSDWLEQNNTLKSKPLPIKILLFAVLTSTIRYEGVFLILIACILLLLHKRILSAILLGFVSALPLVIFGWISVRNGNYFFPNSILVKSGSFEHSNPLHFAYDIIFDRLVIAQNGMATLATQRLLIILPLLYLVFKKYLRLSYVYILIFLFCAAVLQLSFASTGYLYRYEAYLFFGFLIIALVIFYKYGRQALQSLGFFFPKLVAVIAAFFLLFPVVLRGMSGLSKASQGCINIYDQQYQMAAFTKKYYNQSAVALNDIGAVAYFTNAKIIDLWGLANIEITKSKKLHYWTPQFLDSLCRANKVQMAIIYDSWFSDSLTKRWKKAATWKIQNNIICGDSIVSFYSLDSTQNILQQNLKMFQSQLPPSVEVKYY